MEKSDEVFEQIKELAKQLVITEGLDYHTALEKAGIKILGEEERKRRRQERLEAERQTEEALERIKRFSEYEQEFISKGYDPVTAELKAAQKYYADELKNFGLEAGPIIIHD